jgi:hypothetical protein
MTSIVNFVGRELRNLIWVTLLMATLPLTAHSAQQGPTLDQSINEATLMEKSKPTGRASLRIKHYDARRGLFAVYETAQGSRVLFEAGPDERSGQVVIRAKRAHAGGIKTLVTA